MSAKNLIFFIFLINLSYMKLIQAQNYNGTTSNIEQIFIGRCFYFLNILHNQNNLINASNYNCSNLWSSFKTAITNKSPCNIKISDFDDFLLKANHPIQPNTSVFWSGT